MRFSLPQQNKETILIPHLKGIKSLAESNHRILENIRIDSIPFLELRHNLRNEIFNQDIKERIVIGTGHQPVIYHPGIIFKDIVVNALIERYDFLGLNLVVDSDTHGENQYISIPSFKNGHLITKKIQLSHSSANLAFEEIPCPKQQAFNQSLNNIKDTLCNLLPEENLKSLRDYAEIANKVYPISKNLAQFNSLSKRMFEERLNFKHKEVFLSSLCQTETFLYFFVWILSISKDFALVYNDLLDTYRIENGIKHPLTPFSNLKIFSKDSTSIDMIELPFWGWMDNEQRQSLYLRFDKQRACLLDENKKILEFNLNEEIGFLVKIIKQLKYKIRPKALMLTLFARLFLCDVWIHGIGGAEYEGLNDKLAESLLKTLPQYVVASATLHLKLKNEKLVMNNIGDKEISDIKNRLRRMRFNPEDFIDTVDSKINELIKEKKKLLNKIPLSDAKKKRDRYNQLLIINERLRKEIGFQIGELEKTIVKEERLLEDNKIATNRQFPFFIFPLDDLRCLYEGLITKK